MRKTVILKRENATLEENIEYLIDKMDYLLRKVEIYDKALNEFQEVKSTLDEAADNTRKSKDLVRNAFDSVSLHQNDINSLSYLCSDLSQKIEEKFDFLNQRLNVLMIKSQKDLADLEGKIERLRDDIKKELSLYLTLDHLHEIKCYRERQDHEFSLLFHVFQDNKRIYSKEIENLTQSDKESKEKIITIHKEIARIQNAIFRHRMGDPI